jgi:hypothetical protein
MQEQAAITDLIQSCEGIYVSHTFDSNLLGKRQEHSELRAVGDEFLLLIQSYQGI